MYSDNKPLFTLTIGEFTAIARQLVIETLSEKLNLNETNKEKKEDDATFNIKELADFLKCSKVSIHKYKKKGLPFYKIGRKILFRKTEVLNFMRSLKERKIFRK